MKIPVKIQPPAFPKFLRSKAQELEARVGIEGRPPSALLLGLNFSLIIRGLSAFGKTAPPVTVQRTFNARSLKNPLKPRHFLKAISQARL